MCRLAGYFVTQKSLANIATAKKKFVQLLEAQETTATDSTGLGFMGIKGKVWVHKAAMKAHEFLEMETTKRLLAKNNPITMIGHCRLKTHGSPENNQNNHPNFTKGGVITIHNGIISNHEDLFKLYALPRDAEVDSEILGKLIEMYLKMDASPVEAIQTALSEISGSVAMSLLVPQDPNVLYLIRREGFLHIAYDREDGNVYFATEKEALEKVLIRQESFLGFFYRSANQNKVFIRDIPLKTGLRISKDKITTFEVETPPYIPPAYNNSNFGKDFNKHQPYRVWCKTCLHYFDDQGCVHKDQTEVIELNMKFPHPPKNGTQKTLFESGGGFTVGFNVKTPIRKPSRYTTDELNARLVELYGSPGGELTNAEEKEAEKISNTLIHRQASLGAGKLVPVTDEAWRNSVRGGD